MAYNLVWFDGFDVDNATYLGYKYSIANPCRAPAAGRFSGSAASGGADFGVSTYITPVLDTAYQSVLVNFALGTLSQTQNANIAYLLDGATVQTRLTITGGKFIIYRGDGAAALGTSTYTLPNNTTDWVYVEWGMKLDTATGEAYVRVNGANVIALTTQNTQAGTATTANKVSFRLSNTTVFDDFSVYGAAGDAINGGWQGELRVITGLPNADGTVAFTKSTGTLGYANVDDSAPDGDTTYNYSSTPGHEDIFTFADFTITGTVKGVGVQAVGRRDDAGTATLASIVVTSGGTSGIGGAKAVDTTYKYVFGFWGTNPETGTAWDQTAINAASIGYKYIA